MRAANKNRNLRPRTSQPHAPVELGPQAAPNPAPPAASLTAEEVAEREDEEQESPEPQIAAPEAQEAPEAAAAPEPVSDTRAQETVREPAVAHAADVEETKAEEPEEREAAKEEPAEAPISAITKPSTPSPIKAEEPKAAAKVVVPAPKPVVEAREETNPLAETVREEGSRKREEPQKKSEPAKAAPAKEEPKKAAPAKVEPAKAAPAKEEPKKAAPVKEEPKKAAPAKVEPAKAEEAPKSVPSKKQAKKDAEAESRRSASLRAMAESKGLDDEIDQSSISAEFFRKDQDSVPPVEEIEEEDLGKPVVVLSPTTLARRARLRRLVAGVVAFASVITIAVVGKSVMASKKPAPAAPMPTTVMEVKPAPTAENKPAVAEQKPAEEKKAEAAPKPEEKKAEEPAKADDKKADDKKAEEAKKDEPKKDEPKPEEKKAEEAKPAGDPKALTKEAESLLNRGKRKEAMDKAREAIAADPSQAMPYLLLGSALQDSGKWKEGIEAYSECVRNATKGPVNECRAMGGHK
jgi:hypothetical protein